MDQAIQSALDKYYGKTKSSPKKSAPPSRRLIAVIIVAILLALFAVCVKFHWFYADVLWQKISSVSVGSHTVGELAEQTTDKIKDVFGQTETTAPVNPTGQSGEIEATQTMSAISAQYLKYMKERLSFKTPVTGQVTCSYGSRTHPITGKESFHSGMDIAAAKGTPVAAYQCGTVTKVDQNDTYGNCVLITSGELQTFYAHLSSVEVREGQTVESGQAIGKVGSTGLSTGPHLHFEIRIDGQSVDPADYIDATL